MKQSAAACEEEEVRKAAVDSRADLEHWGREKGGSRLPSANSHFHGQKASCDVPECVGPSVVVTQILGGLQELEVVLLFWACVSFLLLLLVPVELCLSCPAGSESPEEIQTPVALLLQFWRWRGEQGDAS